MTSAELTHSPEFSFGGLVDAVLETLYAEYAEYVSAAQRAIPLARLLAYPTHAKRHLIDQLLCVRDPVSLGALDERIVEDVEAILQHEARARAHESVDIAEIPSYPALPSYSTSYSPSSPPSSSSDPASSSSSPPSSVSFMRGDLTSLAGRLAIVNPANTRMLGCFRPPHKCLDNVIHTAAGPGLRNECYAEMKQRGRDELGTGEPMLTGPGRGGLACANIVHVAGPAIERGAKPTLAEREELRAAYAASLDLVAEAGLEAVAFPCISTGVFAFPPPLAAQISLGAVHDWLAAHPGSMRVIFVLWTDADEADYEAAAARIFPHIPFLVYAPPLRIPAKVLEWVRDADSIVIHAGAGLSADAVRDFEGGPRLGLDYTSTEVFAHLYPGLVRRTSLRRLYETIGYEWEDRLTQWGFIFAHAHNTATWGASRVYADLLTLAHSKASYAVMTSNADGLFVQSGFDPTRVYTPQGTYARFQCLTPCTPDSNFDAAPHVAAAMPHLDLHDPRIPENMQDLIPRCERCGGRVFLNVRGGDWFLDGPYVAAGERYDAVVAEMLANAQETGGTVLVLELGAGFNTPSVIRYPSESLAQHPAVRLVRVNAAYPEVPPLENAVGMRTGSAAFLHALLK